MLIISIPIVHAFSRICAHMAPRVLHFSAFIITVVLHFSPLIITVVSHVCVSVTQHLTYRISECAI